MAETASRLPEEDKPDISPEGLRARENASTGTGGSSYSFNRGPSGNSVGRSSGGATDSTAASDGEATDSTKKDDGFYNPNELKDKEESSEDGDDDRVGKGFNPSSSSTSKRKARFQITRRRAAGGGIALILLGGGIGGLSIIQGPLQLVHLSEILQKSFASNEQSSSSRMKGLFRYYRTNDIGETRVSKIGSVVFKNTTTKLEAIGYDFNDRNKLSGHLKSVTIDTSKHPDFKGLRPAERRAAIQRHLNIQDSSVLTQTGQNKYKVNLDATSARGMSFNNDLVKTAAGDLHNGKLVTGMNQRVLKKFYNQSDLFSPISKRTRALENRLAAKAETRAEKKAAEKARGEQRLQSLRESPFGVKAAAKKDKLKSVMNEKRVALTAGLTFTSGACLVRDIKSIGPAVDRAEIIIPSVLESTDKKAVGEKVKAGGKDLDARDPGVVASSFTDDDGKTIWQGKALQALSGKANPNGEDLPDKHKQAFSSKTSSEIEEIAGSVGAIACSTPSLLAQGALGIALVFTGPGGWAVNAGKTAANLAGTAAVMAVLISRYSDSLEDKAQLDLPLAGALGGNLMAHASRESANIGARAQGGIAMSNTQTAALEREHEAKNQQEFHSKSFATRMFDVRDYRSVAGSFIDNTSLNPNKAVASISSSLTNIGSVASGLFTSLLPKSYAAATPYDWGFPKYGISKDIIEDRNYEDPYENADKVAVILNDGGGGYVDRAKNCFGVRINKDSGVWDAPVPEEEVDPNDDAYKGANCNDTSDPKWKRIILFVFDTRLLTSVACYEGDEAACSELGFGTPQAGTSSTVTGEGVAKIVAVAEQEYSKNGNKPLETCGENCGPEVQKYTGGPSGPGAPWCAWFVSWVYREAGYEFKGAPAGSDGNIPAVSNLISWFKQHGIHFTPSSTEYKPEPGDVVMYGGGDHTGIVVKVSGDTIETVEGNTSGDGSFNANGETVGRKKYNYKTYASRSIEFGRVKNP